jgi:hypothetical protein
MLARDRKIVAILLGSLAFLVMAYVVVERQQQPERETACRAAVGQACDLLLSLHATRYEWEQALKKAEQAIRTEEDRRLVHRLIAFEAFMTGGDDTFGFKICTLEIDDILGFPAHGNPRRAPEQLFKWTEERLNAAERARYEKMLPLVRQESDPSPCLDEWERYQIHRESSPRDR